MIRRKGQLAYLYGSVRVGPSARSVYLGPIDPDGIEAQLIDLRRRRAEAERAARRLLAECERAVRGYVAAVAAAVRAALEPLGYHAPNRGPIRRRRAMTPATTAPAPLSTPAARPTAPDPGAALAAIEARERAGDPAALAEWAAVGVKSKDPARRGAMHAELARLRAELEGPDPSPLERLLCERVALCHLDLHHAEGQVVGASLLGESVRMVEMRDRMRDRAHRRYLSAIKALAAVRRLEAGDVRVLVAAVAPAPPAPTGQLLID